MESQRSATDIGSHGSYATAVQRDQEALQGPVRPGVPSFEPGDDCVQRLDDMEGLDGVHQERVARRRRLEWVHGARIPAWGYFVFEQR